MRKSSFSDVCPADMTCPELWMSCEQERAFLQLTVVAKTCNATSAFLKAKQFFAVMKWG